MSRIVFVSTITIVAVLATVLGYDGHLGKILERIPPLVSILIQALLAVSVLIGIIDGEWRRWFKGD
jgi:hypothetical protein